MTKKNQKFVSVDASVLGFRKAIPVLESNRNQMLAMDMQLSMSKLEEQDTEDYKATLTTYTNIIKEEVEFLAKVLKLDEDKIDEVYDLDQEETVQLIMEVITKIMHIDTDKKEDEKSE